jgi:hypothetical protein
MYCPHRPLAYKGELNPLYHLRILDLIRSLIASGFSTPFHEGMSLFVQSATCVSKNTNSCLQFLKFKWEERTFNASFLEKLFSQCPQGKGFNSKWIRLCRLRSWLRLKDCGHWSHLNGRLLDCFCCGCCSCTGVPTWGGFCMCMHPIRSI